MVRARIAVSIVSALAVLVVVSGLVARTNDIRPALSSAAIGAAHALAKVPFTASPRLRLACVTPGRLSHVQGMPVIRGLVGVGVIGRSGRRITDAGHDWRSLLVGAPPPLP